MILFLAERNVRGAPKICIFPQHWIAVNNRRKENSSGLQWKQKHFTFNGILLKAKVFRRLTNPQMKPTKEILRSLRKA